MGVRPHLRPLGHRRLGRPQLRHSARAGHVYDKGRAHGFCEVTQAKLKKGERSVRKVRNPLFVQLDKPVYGAVVMAAGPGGHGHRVGFVQARSDPNELMLLGGKHYAAFAQTDTQALPTQTAGALVAFGIGEVPGFDGLVAYADHGTPRLLGLPMKAPVRAAAIRSASGEATWGGTFCHVLQPINRRP